jgi:uncharacterized protein YdcH (DUF465 family)
LISTEYEYSIGRHLDDVIVVGYVKPTPSRREPMPITTREVRQFLMAQDPDFRRLVEEHTRCECQLEALLDQDYRNSEDLVQEVVLKKLKLQLKDQMAQLVADFQHRFAAA